jgi:cytochrome oxidase Cu insertion factor (SCO1/SenC/PrrC family)
VLKEVNENVKNVQQEIEELTAEEETQKALITKLETSRQELTSDNDMLKNKTLCVQQAIYEAGKRKQVRNVYFLLGSKVLQK